MGVETEHDLVPHVDASAAVMIQKTYRGYRARRKLADAAIMSKPVGWWNVVDSVVLQQQTQQYYAHSKSWKANDNWKRLKRKASKLGKGLEKNNKALKLALQHWLEAVDARHRYGHNLRPYYLYWHDLDTHEPFFYWLDLGCGRQVEVQKCSRATLQEQQITYLSPEQRKHYEVAIYHGKLYYQSSGELVHTPDTDRWIFVMSPSYKLYIGKKQKGKFQHSSFLAGGATTAAGRLVVTHGVLKLMEAHSGHYRPSPENFEALVGILVNRGADLHLAKVQLVSDDLLEKKRAKELAGKVRQAIEDTCGDGHVDVKVENQRLVSVDSGLDGGSATEYLVTNLTFPEFETAMANKKQAEAEDLTELKSNEAHAEALSKEQVTNHVNQPSEQATNDVSQPSEQATNHVSQPEQVTNHVSQPEQVTNHVSQPSEVTNHVSQPSEQPVTDLNVTQPSEQVTNHVSQAEQVINSKPIVQNGVPEEVQSKEEVAAIVELIIVKKKPTALVLPVCNLLEQEALGPKTARLPPASPGFSRNSHLANLGPQERRQTLKKYGPRKNAFPGTKPQLETIPSQPLTC